MLQNDYRTYADVRDQVIDSIIPENERAEITNVMRSVELALIASDPGKKLTVSREGTEVLELYIRYLERYIFKQRNLRIPTPAERKLINEEVTCTKCKGTRYVNEQVKKKRVPKVCPLCNGTGNIKKEKEIA